MAVALATARVPGRAANLRLAAAPVAPGAHGYDRSLRPCHAWFSRAGNTICTEGDR